MLRRATLLLALFALPVLAKETSKTVTVSSDGSGDYKTVQAAVDAVPDANAHRVVIHLKPGTYKERVHVPRSKPMITFQGDDAEKTVVANDWNASHAGPEGKPVGTSGSYTVSVEAPDFIADNITFENTAGDTGQAVALYAKGDRQVYRHCRMLGWQDTLYAEGGRQYYDHCYIEGRVDFIFGSAVAVFDHCQVVSKNGGYVTAARTPPDQPWGYVFLDCKLTSPDAAPTYLGRPWREYASVTFVRCELGFHIRPEGWSIWKGTERHKTARYAEYQCTGPGADRSKRVEWSKALTDDEAKGLTVEGVLGGADHWDPRKVEC